MPELPLPIRRFLIVWVQACAALLLAGLLLDPSLAWWPLLLQQPLLPLLASLACGYAGFALRERLAIRRFRNRPLQPPETKPDIPLPEPDPRCAGLAQLPELAPELPLKFRSGFTISGYTGRCRHCDGELAMAQARGRVWRPERTRIEVEGVFLCTWCGADSYLRLRLHSDWSISRPLVHGQWQTSDLSASRTGLLLRLRYWLLRD